VGVAKQERAYGGQVGLPVAGALAPVGVPFREAGRVSISERDI